MSRSAMIGNGDVDAEARLDRADPRDVGVVAVDREAQKLGVQRGEVIGAAGEGHEFGGADRREIGRMREQDQPLAAIIGEVLRPCVVSASNPARPRSGGAGPGFGWG
jgi:hypothetical protein